MTKQRIKAALLCGIFLIGCAGPGLLAFTAKPAQAQNPTCPTRPVGDSTNACASTAFVNSTAFTSGRPWCSVRGAGAKGDAATDDTAAFNTCINTLAALNGGILWVDDGYYCLASGITTPVGVAIEIFGSSHTGTRLAPCNGSASVVNDVTVVTLGGSFSSLNHLTIYGKGSNFDPVFGATVPVVSVSSTAGGVQMNDAEMQGGSSALEWLGSDGRAYSITATGAYLNANILVRNNAGLKIISSSTNQGFAVSNPSPGITVNPWSAGAPYSPGDIVTIVQGGQTYTMQARLGGNAGGVQPALKNYLLDIVDNTVTWRLLANAQAFGIQCDTGCSELFLSGVDDGCVCAASFAMTNTLAGTAPHIVRVLHGTWLALNNTVLLQAGNDFEMDSTNIYGCFVTNCSAVGTNSAFTNGLSIIGGEVVNTPGVGVNFTVGTGLSVKGVNFSGNTTAISVAANITDFNISNNVFTSNTTNITIAAGTSNRYRILGNIYNGGGSPTDGGTGTDKVVDRTSRMTIGTAQLGDFSPATGTAYFQTTALSAAVATNYALIQNSAGATAINAPTGQVIDFRINNVQGWRINSDLGIFANGATGSSKGAGTVNTLADYQNGVQELIPIESTLDLFVNPNTGGNASCKDGTLTCGAGNDTTGNGSQATPWATIQKCADEVSGKYFIRKAQVTCWVADNTNITQAVILRPYQGNQLYQSLQPAIRGNCTTPGNTVIKGASTGAVFSVAAMSNAWTIQGFDIAPTSAGDTAYFVDEYAQLNIGNTRFTSAMNTGITSRYQSFVEIIANGGAITCAGSLTISANQAAFANAYANSTILGQGSPGAQTVTLTGTPAFSNAWVVCADGGYIDLQSFSYVGSASAGTSRYNCANGHVAPAGTTMPGGTAGLAYIYVPGSTSGQAAIVATAAAGTPTLTLPTTSGTFALTANNLGAFAATTSAQLFGVISDETGGGGVLVGSSGPTLTGTTNVTDLTASGTVRANTAFNANGNTGQNISITVRASGGAADCTIVFTGGLKTGGTC